jgi:hypothetical protein
MNTRTVGSVVMALVMGLLASTAFAQQGVYVAGDNGVIIKGAKGGPYTISRDGGKTWAGYPVRVLAPKLVPVPPARGQACDFYQCGGRIIAVPVGTARPQTGVHVGSGTIDGRRVDPRTNVLR